MAFVLKSVMKIQINISLIKHIITTFFRVGISDIIIAQILHTNMPFYDSKLPKDSY